MDISKISGNNKRVNFRFESIDEALVVAPSLAIAADKAKLFSGTFFWTHIQDKLLARKIDRMSLGKEELGSVSIPSHLLPYLDRSLMGIYVNEGNVVDSIYRPFQERIDLLPELDNAIRNAELEGVMVAHAVHEFVSQNLVTK